MDRMLTYADGDALGHVLTAAPESIAWCRWSDENAARLVTSPLGLTELHTLGPVARARAHDVAERISVIRFSDQSLASAAEMLADVPPFTAIHLGIAVSHPDIDSVATYDAILAGLAASHGLDIISPGRNGPWWHK
jgi:uncharacterized protein